MSNHSSSVRVRFAPSPTGPIHLGGIRTALYNYLFAKKCKGTFILRIEDTDPNRFVEHSETHILESLKWCGILPDEGVGCGGSSGPYYQSQRGNIYRFYIHQLLQNGHAYYAFDTDQEIDQKKKECQDRGIMFSYNHRFRMELTNSLTMTKQQLHSKLQEGVPYVVRFKIRPGKILNIRDLVRGNIVMHTEHLDDKILLKSNGMATYHLASTIDDYLMRITHVIRGSEWIPSMFLHVLLYRSFGWISPHFVHLPLILRKDGKGKISKRNLDGNFPVFPIQWKDLEHNKVIPGYRELGYFPESFVNMLVLLGWNPGKKKEIFSLHELEDMFSLNRIKKSNVFFDIKKSIWFNKQYVCKNKQKVLFFLYEKLTKRSILYKKNYVVKVIDLTIDRIYFIHEIWSHTFYFFVSPHTYDISWLEKKDKHFIISTLKNLYHVLFHMEDSLENIKGEFYNKIKEDKKRYIMQMMRLALIGCLKGIDLITIIRMIGKEESMKRIQKLIDHLNEKI
ncbi:glutamate--tRNA ligase [Blattabacterium cuenoti]|uniref:glutamate--tRNA ligase n=1 Tax=Blattabacterium cuenoti TaxID=1653831 RepID=UPI00163C9126|nr:glutamate--tRNA ligase [Blattabacterium cuenoti]